MDIKYQIIKGQRSNGTLYVSKVDGHVYIKHNGGLDKPTIWLR